MENSKQQETALTVNTSIYIVYLFRGTHFIFYILYIFIFSAEAYFIFYAEAYYLNISAEAYQFNSVHSILISAAN